MTREEAIKIFLDRGWIKLENGTYFDGSKWREAIMVISDYFRNEYKALEQGSIIDKIRVEIIQSIQNGTIKIENGNEELFRIIDKYKSESEGE